MTNRNNNRDQPHTAGNKAKDTEFGTEANLSKKARKRAAREQRKNG
jgi:hypothetical protein